MWFADEARVGQKNKITRRWAKRGTRPSAPSDQRTASTYIFGAICPKEGKAVGLILPKCNTEAMQLHLDEIAKDVASGRHAVLLIDRAGWHTSRKLDVPDNLTLFSFRPSAPSSTRRKTSGSSCATTGSRTASSSTTTISSIIAAKPGTNSEANHGASCPSECDRGPTGSNQREVVLDRSKADQ